jgi:protein-disulfide isomerase
MNKKGNIGAIVAVLAIVALFTGVVIWRAVDKANKASIYDVNSVIEANDDNGGIADHVKGDLDKAKVVIFEYADYQCSACASHNPRINKLLSEYGDDLAVVFRVYLLSYHQNGTAAASAAEAAGLQGYWREYADKLFANQAVWYDASGDERTDIFVSLFNSVTDGKGDEAKFRKDMASSEVSKKVSFDNELANRVNITETPSFYMNGEKIVFQGASGEEGFLNVFREKIDEALEK